MNLVRQTAWAVGAVSAAMLGLIGAAGYALVQQRTLETERQRVEMVANEAAQIVRSRLNQASAMTQALAVNPAVRNSLVDSAGRETYIRPILEGMSLIDGQAVAWSLADYGGQPIIESRTATAPEGRAGWWRELMSSGVPGALVHRADGAIDHVTIARPVVLPNTQAHEGVVSVQLPVSSVLAGLSSEGRTFRLDLAPAAADSLAASLGRVSVPLSLAPPLAALGLRLQAEVSEDHAQQALARLRWQMLAAVLAASAALMVLSMWAARRLTRPIRRLVSAAQAVAEGRQDVTISAGSAASDEMALLAQSLQQMVERLRAAARAEHQEALAQFRAIFDNSRIGMRLGTCDGRHLHANQALLQMIGYTNEELARAEALALTLPEDRAAMGDVVSGLASGRLPDHREEKRLLCKSGSTLWVSLVMTPLRDSQGAVTGIAAQYEDITQRRLQAQALAASEARYRTLIEWMPLPMWVLRDGHCVFANDAAQRAIGARSTAQLIGSDPYDRVDPEFRDLLRRREDALSESPHAAQPRLDIRLLRMDGTPIDVEAHITAIEWDGLPARVWVWRDVTERVAQARALEDSEQRFRALIEWTPEAVIVVRDGIVLYVNPAAAGLFGAAQASAMVGTGVIDRVHPDSRELALGRLRTPAQAEATRLPKVELKFLRLDGTVIDAEVQSTRIMFDGAPAAHIAWRDVTEHKRAREALQYSEANLRQSQQVARLGSFEFVLADSSTRWSDEMCRIFGILPGEVVTLESYRGMVAPEVYDRVMLLVADTVETGRPYEIEHPLVMADGTVKHVYAMGRAVRDDQGQVHSIFGVVQDITERKNAELRQQAEEERLRFHDDLHEATRDAIDAREILRVLTEMLGRHVGASRCGWTRADLETRTMTIEAAMEVPGLPMSIVGTFPLDGWGTRNASELEQGRTLVLRDIAREMASDPAVAAWQGVGTAAFIGCPVLRLGRLHGMLAVDSAVPRDWTDGEVRLIEEVAQRASATIQRAQAESAMRRSEAALRDAQRVAGVGSYDFDVRSHALEWSEELCRIFGVEPGTVASLDIYRRLLSPADFERAMQDMDRAVASGEPYSREQQITLPDGSRRQLHLIGRPMRDADGQVRRIFGTVQDVSAQRHVEARLRAALHEKEILLKEIYHRVKNNLQVVSGLLMLQSRQVGAGHAAPLLEQSANRVKSMALVHEQLYQQSDLSSINFADYLAQLVGNLGDSYAEVANRVRVRLDVRPVTLGIETAVPLGLIVNELLSNAFKHAYPAGRSGEIRVRLSMPAAGGIELEVSDDGVGLPAGVLPDAVPSLGMRLVVSLAQQLDATLDCSPRGGSGTCFTLQFVPELAEPARLRA
jgi:PAS domain S-box-containing protein